MESHCRRNQQGTHLDWQPQPQSSVQCVNTHSHTVHTHTPAGSFFSTSANVTHTVFFTHSLCCLQPSRQTTCNSAFWQRKEYSLFVSCTNRPYSLTLLISVLGGVYFAEFSYNPYPTHLLMFTSRNKKCSLGV